MLKSRSLLLAGAALCALAAAPALAEETSDLRKAAEVDRTFTFTLTEDSIRAAMQPRLTVRDDLSPTNDPFEAIANSVDADNTWAPVAQIFLQVGNRVGTNCTGALINPRTVLTAAHCANFFSSETYGLPFEAPASFLVGFGPDTETAFFNYINTGARHSQGGLARSTDVIIHPSANLDNGALPFPWADVAMIALGEPITDVPTMAMLFSPLDELTRVVLTGYGQRGTGEFGAGFPTSPFQRLEGENMLGMIGSPADLFDGIVPDFAPTSQAGQVTQVMYMTDFDRPDRTQADLDGCDFVGFDVICDSLRSASSIDWFDGDALPNEAGTSFGDSGSPMIATELADFPIILGVLSGGYDFFGLNSGYGDISFYNPLFPFFEFISANSPYKYVSANAGDGLWTDPDHWTQDLDPNFYIFDETGALVNGLPEGPEEGVYATGPKIGTVVGTDISNFPTDSSPLLPPRNAGAVAAGASGESLAAAIYGAVHDNADDGGMGVWALGDWAQGDDADAGVTEVGRVVLGAESAAAEDAASESTTQDAPGFGNNLPQSSPLQGPGSTGFVPNNTDRKSVV